MVLFDACVLIVDEAEDKAPTLEVLAVFLVLVDVDMTVVLSSVASEVSTDVVAPVVIDSIVKSVVADKEVSVEAVVNLGRSEVVIDVRNGVVVVSMGHVE